MVSLLEWTFSWLAPCNRTAPHHNRLRVFLWWLFCLTNHKDTKTRGTLIDTAPVIYFSALNERAVQDGGSVCFPKRSR